MSVTPDRNSIKVPEYTLQ